MADIAPLRPLRYATSDLASVVSPPYDVIALSERSELIARSPHNVVRLILPEGEGESKYGHAARLLQAWRLQEVLVRDEQPALYRYDQSFAPPPGGARRTRRGFLALVRLVPLEDRIVLPHERTLAGAKEDRLKLFRATRTNLSPGFMLYRDPGRTLDPALGQAEALASFVTPDRVEHTLAKVHHPDAIRAVVEHLAHSSLLIADGHHRYETALRYAQEIDAVEPAKSQYVSDPEHRYFMSFLCNEDDPNLLILATHRLVHSLPSFDAVEFLQRASALFQVTPLFGSLAAALQRLAEAGRKGCAFLAVVPGPQMALLTLRAVGAANRHPTLHLRPPVVRQTDVAVLHSGILEHLLGISLEAQANKTHLTYVQDPEAGVAQLQRQEGQVLFLMNPTPVAQVREVAEAGEIMPQKSTFFYPKILTGLAIHTLDPQRSVSPA